jgi:hypothetical protein
MGILLEQVTSHGHDTDSTYRADGCLVFLIHCLSFSPVVYCFYPETAGRKLEDMDEMFIRNPSWLVFGNKELTQPTRPQAFIDAELARVSDSQVTTIEVAATPDKAEKQ